MMLAIEQYRAGSNLGSWINFTRAQLTAPTFELPQSPPEPWARPGEDTFESTQWRKFEDPQCGEKPGEDVEVTVFTPMRLNCTAVREAVKISTRHEWRRDEGRGTWAPPRSQLARDGGWEMPPGEISAVSRVQGVAALKISARQLTRRTISCGATRSLYVSQSCVEDCSAALMWTRNVSRDYLQRRVSEI